MDADGWYSVKNAKTQLLFLGSTVLLPSVGSITVLYSLQALLATYSGFLCCCVHVHVTAQLAIARACFAYLSKIPSEGTVTVDCCWEKRV